MKKSTSLHYCLATLLLLQPAGAQAQSVSPPAPAVAPAVDTTQKDSAFQQMLVYVYQQNPRLQSARQSLKVLDERVSEAVAGFRPTLNASGDIGRQRVAAGGDPWTYGTARDESLVLNQTVFNGFGTEEQFHAARARVSAERAHLTTVEEQVLFDSIAAYLDVVAKKYVLMFNRDNRDHLKNYSDSAGKRLKAGDGTKTDVAQAESRLAQADANIASAEAAWQSSAATYKRVTGLDVSIMEFPPMPAGLPQDAPSTVALAQQAPEFSEAAEQERAAKHDIEAASSNLWPIVSIRGSMSDSFSPTLGLENLRDDSVTLNVSIPLYQGGADYARVREARELREKAHDDLADTSRLMTERGSQAWYNYHASSLVIDASRRNAEAAYRALNGVEIEQRQGARTMEDTLDARAEFLNALISEVQAEENARLQAYRLLASTGQLTAASLQLETPLYDPKKHYDKVENAWVGLN